ncbi:MAG: HD domain-containing protein, partial [Oligoflexia bacterium]|nr:HD domain-containing protein [Oligoflexia bacterium]
QKPILTDDPYKYTYFNPDIDEKTGYKTKSILAIPLKNNEGEFIGVFQALNKTTHDGKFSEQDIEYLTLAASYSAKAIESAMLYQEIDDTQKEIIITMGAIGENRSKETANHVKRVAEYSKLLALKCGLTESEAELLRLASPMHDIGKVGIPDAILNKQGKLSPDEFDIIKKHTELGFELLAGSSRRILKASAIVAHEHHEKFNGTGYPQGKKGEDIHIFGRITALADVFDALGSDRCYKKAWPIENIVELFKEEKDNHFDGKLVDIFLENLDQFLKIRDTYTDEMGDDNISNIIKALNKYSC